MQHGSKVGHHVAIALAHAQAGSSNMFMYDSASSGGACHTARLLLLIPCDVAALCGGAVVVEFTRTMVLSM
jgi:hypothetical protein